MKFGILLAFIILASNVSALCNETQVDINTASFEELQEITQVGNSTAQEIINYRTNNKTFDSVDELINVKYIGDTRLAKIKEQGLACVSVEEVGTTPANGTDTESASGELFIDESANSSENKNAGEVGKSTDIVNVENVNYIDEINSPPKTINLTPKDIKSDKRLLKTGNNNIAFYGLGIFGILLAFLFALKHYRMRKNEF